MCWYGFLNFADWEWGVEGKSMERLIRNRPGLHYPVELDSGQSVSDPTGKVWSQPRERIDINCYHMNRITETNERLFKKMSYYVTRDHGRKVKRKEDLGARDRQVLDGDFRAAGYKHFPIKYQPEQIIKMYDARGMDK